MLHTAEKAVTNDLFGFSRSFVCKRGLAKLGKM